MRNLIKYVHLSSILMRTNLPILIESFHVNLILTSQILFIQEAGIKSFQCLIFEQTDLFVTSKVLISQEIHLTIEMVFYCVEVIE